MIIGFSDITSRVQRTKDISYESKEDSFFFDNEKIEFASNLIVNGNIEYDAGLIILRGKVKTNLKLTCSRCLDTYIYPIDIDIEERFTNDDSNLDEDVIFVKGDEIDITEIVENAIISSLPIKKLCKEDCKGLCQKCGCNLNHETCSCENDDVDIRFAGLKALFNDEEV